jgi:transposase
VQVEKVLEENKNLKDEVKRLHHIIQLLKRDKFGSKAERFEEITDQLVFNEIELEAPKAPPEKETITYTRNKGRKRRKAIPEGVPREEKIIDIPEDEKTCPYDGTALKCVGEVRSEKLKTIPAQTSVVVEKRLKYACPCCEEHMNEAKANSILPGTIATPEILSFIVFSKFFQALPLYRLEEMYKLQGINLKRSTMASWMIKVSEKLRPLWNILEDMMFESGYVTIDATRIQVLKEEGRKPQTKSAMWVRGSPERGIILFDYNISEGGAIAKSLMEGYEGALQADAHRGYGALEKRHLTLLGCLMHSRRRFYKAWLAAKKAKGLASEGLALIKWLYDKEESYRERNLTPEERKYWRDLEIAPSMLEIKKWCEYHQSKVLPQSPIGNAINYFINEYEELSAFLKDGRYEMDNGWTERQIKKYAIGRKNWVCVSRRRYCDELDIQSKTTMLCAG